MDLIPKNFEDMFDNITSFKGCNIKCDIYQKNGMYQIEAEVPGYKKEDIKLEYSDGYLTIKGKKDQSKDEESKDYIKRERSSNECQRQIYVGDVDETNIKAKYDNGILHIEVPKPKEKENGKKIEIN